MCRRDTTQGNAEEGKDPVVFDIQEEKQASCDADAMKVWWCKAEMWDR